MKHYEEKIVTRHELVRETCDLCGCDTDEHPDDGLTSDTITVEHRHTEMEEGYGGDVSSIEIDICPTCFRDKVMPALRNLGLKKDYAESSW